jgi:hypothetical protein
VKLMERISWQDFLESRGWNPSDAAAAEVDPRLTSWFWNDDRSDNEPHSFFSVVNTEMDHR